MFARDIINVIKLYFIGRHLHALLRVFCQSSIFLNFWKFQIGVQTLPGLRKCCQVMTLQSILRWHCMLRSNRNNKYYQLRARVNHHRKFCFDISWTNNSTLNILICLVKSKIALRTKFYEGHVSVYHVNCLLGTWMSLLKFNDWSWKIVLVELSNFKLSESFLYFTKLDIFKYELHNKCLNRFFDLQPNSNNNFFPYFPRKFYGN